MNYDDITRLNQADEPSNDELREIEEHLDDYIDEQDQPIIIFIIIKISNILIVKSALRSD